MIIALNTSSPTATLVLLEPNGAERARKQWEAGRELSSQLLDEIEVLLADQQLIWTDLSGVLAFQGPGSFTGLRIGITVANAIAYAQAIPIAGGTGKDWLADGIDLLRTGQGSTQITPKYGAEPNITRPAS